MFEKTFVINLPFKTERLEAFQRAVPRILGEVQVWPAVHGDSIQHPSWWKSGRGAWGCLRSHLQILEYCYQQKVESYLVCEDDSIFRPDFTEVFTKFMAELPGDWQQVYLGGQLLHEMQHPPRKVSDNVYVPHNVNRTHCFAVHQRGYEEIYKHLNEPFRDCEHIDHHMGRLHETGAIKIYCPGKWIVGQDSGPSSISGNNNAATYWVDPEKLSDANRAWQKRPIPAVFLEASIETAVELERRGWHRGKWQNEHRLDRGVCDAISAPDTKARLTEWHRIVTPEAVREGKTCVCLHHPSLHWDCVKQLECATFHRIVAANADEAESQLAAIERPETSQAFSEQRHLIYHLWPRKGNGQWQWNVRQLLKRIEQFDGARTIAVATGEDADLLVDVQREFDGARIDNWLEIPNDQNLWEVASFSKMMETLPQRSGFTFYGHGKGVRHDGQYNTKKWAEAMYEICLDDPAFVEESLNQYAITGPFKRGDDSGMWHYSGTFFWFRNKDVFSRDWRKIDNNHMGVEFWTRNVFGPHEGGSLFGHQAGWLYDDSEWDSHIQPWLDNWRKQKRSV